MFNNNIFKLGKLRLGMHGYIDRLQRAGLTGNEAKVYLELLRKGSLSANEIAKKISMDRTLAYTVLNNLIEKGMANYIIKKGKKFFQASEPKHLLNPIKEKEVFVKDLIGELEELEEIEEAVREVNVYEGLEGMRTVLKDLMKYKDASVFGSTGRAYDLIYDLPHIAEAVGRKNLDMRIITTTKYKKHPVTTKFKWIKYRYLDIKSEATTVIVADKIAIFLSIYKPIIIVIKNKEIAESYQNHFEVLWRVAKKI